MGTHHGAAAGRAVFLDVDGTYAHRGVVPPAHAGAVRAARKAGNLVFLCTGRPASMLGERLTSAGFDGVVASAGAHVTVGGEVLRDERFPADLSAALLAALDRHGATYVLETPDEVVALPGVEERMERALGGMVPDETVAGGRRRPDILARLRTAADLSDVAFSKISCFGCAVPVTDVAREVGPAVGVVPSSIAHLGGSAGEFHQAWIDKSVGIRTVGAHLGFGPERVVAFGDGLNDVEMLEYAGTGVAIADADPRVLAAADRVAAGPAQEGLVAAFEELGLL